MRLNALLKADVWSPSALTASADTPQTVESKGSRLQRCSSKTVLLIASLLHSVVEISVIQKSRHQQCIPG